MTLRAEYGLGHSEYNAFLFAAVGEEKIGLTLTVQTALVRLGVDPWQEAARLADLPREAAARAFAKMIAQLPEGDWKAADAEAIATRLVSRLPAHSAPPIPAPGPRRTDPTNKPGVPLWLVVGAALLLAALAATLYL